MYRARVALDASPPVTGDRAHARLPLALLALLTLICLATLWAPPAGRKSWVLEVTPGLLYVGALAVLYRRFPMSNLVYGGLFVHVLILIYGGCYTYALTPLGNWMRDHWHLARNPYDRVGHFALGFFPAITIREVLLRKTPLERGGWLTFIILSIVLAIGAFWELIEWWTALLVDPAAGTAFLGSQGDPWDAQQDMAMALFGSIVSQAALGSWHGRQIKRLTAASRGQPE